MSSSVGRMAAAEERQRLVRILEGFDPTSQDLDAIREEFPSTFASFTTLCSVLKTSIIALPILLSLDYSEVVADVQDRGEQHEYQELERWVGFVPENRPDFPRDDWFGRFAQAGLFRNEPRLLRKLIRLGHTKIVCDLDDWTTAKAEIFARVIDEEKNSKVGDSLLLGFLNRSTVRNDNREELLTSYLSHINHASDWICSILLNRKVIQPPANLFLLLRSIDPDREFFERIAAVWSDESFVQTSNLSRHSQLSAVIRFCMKLFKNQIPEEVVALLVQGVSNHLASNVEEKRRLGMIVGEEFSQAYGDNAQPLDFDLDRSSFFDDYAAGLDESSATSMEKKQNQCDASPVEPKDEYDINNPDQVVIWPWRPPPTELWEQAEDGDALDDETCSLEPYELSDNAMEGLASIPKHLSQIPPLLVSDKYESVQIALVHLSDIIKVHRNRPDTHRRAARLIWTLLELQNRFDLADFEMNRTNALISLIVCTPKESGPALARAIYSREINVGTKLVALSAYVEGTRILAEGGFRDLSEEEEEKNKLAAQDERVLGTVLRKSRRTEISQKQKVFRNALAPVAYEYFFLPLCRRVAEFENEPILLCKVVTALGLVLERARHAGGSSVTMAEALLELLPWMNRRPESEVRRATLFSLAAIASVSRSLIQDWIPWIQLVAAEDPDAVAREIANKLSGL